MARSHDPQQPRSTRRDVLKRAGLTTAAASLGAVLRSPSLRAAEPVLASTTAATPSGDSANRHLVSGIEPKNLVDEYERRNLDAVSDANLCQQVAAIVSKPPAKGGGSFILHAPLELLARYGLLPLVDPKERSLARLQMVASAATYETTTTAGPAPKKITPFANPSDAQAEFARAFQQGSADGIEAIMLQFAAQFGTARLVQLLTPLALPTLTGASHSHIGLWLLLRHARASDVGDADLLRVAARSLSRDPKSQLRSFSGMVIEGSEPLKQTPEEVEKEILDKLAAPPRKAAGLGGMQALFTAGEATGNTDTLFTDFIRHDLTNEQIDAAFRAVLRVCAHSMLQHSTQHAKFGWSHCLTLPQAACGLSSLNINRKLALASTLVWITSYRSVLSNRDLDFQWSPKKLEGSASVSETLQTSPSAAASRVWYADPVELPLIKQTLATQASIRTDQHLIKYTRACFDMVSFDPEYEHLYLAAAAHLCGLWVKERPEANLKNDLLKGRTLP
jgi:hypothetical protein